MSLEPSKMVPLRLFVHIMWSKRIHLHPNARAMEKQWNCTVQAHVHRIQELAPQKVERETKQAINLYGMQQNMRKLLNCSS